MSSYLHPIYGRREITLDEAMSHVRRLAGALAEIHEEILEYDDAHPDFCPDDGDGYRLLPGFYLHSCITACDFRDAQAMLAAYHDPRTAVHG